MLNKYIQNLFNIFTQLPTLSENNARKIVLSLITRSKIKGILHTLNNIDQKLSQCLCGNVDELINEQCSLCNKKESSKILIVLSINDLFTIENSGIYEGQYHIICNDNISLTSLRIEELMTRIKNNITPNKFNNTTSFNQGLQNNDPLNPSSSNQNLSNQNLSNQNLSNQNLPNQNLQEIILALSYHYLSSTIEKYILKQLEKYPNIKITKIQTGIPVGSSLNNENESTLKAALLSRQEIQFSNEPRF